MKPITFRERKAVRTAGTALPESGRILAKLAGDFQDAARVKNTYDLLLNTGNPAGRAIVSDILSQKSTLSRSEFVSAAICALRCDAGGEVRETVDMAAAIEWAKNEMDKRRA